MQSIFAVLHGGKGHRQTDEGSKTNHIHHVFREHGAFSYQPLQGRPEKGQISWKSFRRAATLRVTERSALSNLH